MIVPSSWSHSEPWGSLSRNMASLGNRQAKPVRRTGEGIPMLLLRLCRLTST